MPSNRSPQPKLPPIEQPIMVGFEMESFHDVTRLALEGLHAAVVVRSNQYHDFNEEVLQPLLEEFRLGISGTQTFGRTPVSRRSLENEREGLHLDAEEAFDPARRVTYPRTLTVSHTIQGHGLLVASAGSSRVRAYTGHSYDAERLRLNRDRKVKSFYQRAPTRPGFNAVYEVEHKGLRGDVGLVHIGEGDAVVIPQGGGESISPSWHAIITQDVTRNSLSYHTVPTKS